MSEGSDFTLSIPDFSRNAATVRMHNLPRFGHSNSFSDIWDDENTRNDYIVGLLFAGIFLASFLFAWIVVLLVLKCVPGVGFLNGSPLSGKPEYTRRNKIIRGTFIVSAVLVLAFAICFVTEGLTQLDNTVDTMNLSGRQIQSLSTRAARTIADMRLIRNSTATNLPLLVGEIESFCPADPLINEEAGIAIQEVAEEVVGAVADLGDLLAKQLPNLTSAVNDIRRASTDFVDTTQDININDWQSLIIIIPFTLVSLFLIVVTVLAWKDKEIRPLLCLKKWFVLPLFILMVVAAFAVSAGVAIAASANADFCSGGDDKTPRGSIIEILRHEGFSQQDLVVQMIRFYISRCTAEDPLVSERLFETGLNATISAAEAFNETIYDVGQEFLTDRCGEGYTTNVFYLTALILGNLVAQAENIGDLLSLAACNEIVPLYTNTFERGTCKYSIKGATWMFSAFLVVGVFGMLMITLRSSLLLDADDDSWYDETFVEKGDSEVIDMSVPQAAESSFEDESRDRTPSVRIDNMEY